LGGGGGAAAIAYRGRVVPDPPVPVIRQCTV